MNKDNKTDINIFISQPMRGKTDIQISEAKESAIVKIKDFVKRTKNCEIKIIDTFFSDFNGNRLQFLGKSILEGLALADLAVFLPNWEKMDGCRSEHFVAVQYGVEILYINE